MLTAKLKADLEQSNYCCMWHLCPTAGVTHQLYLRAPIAIEDLAAEQFYQAGRPAPLFNRSVTPQYNALPLHTIDTLQARH